MKKYSTTSADGENLTKWHSDTKKAEKISGNSENMGAEYRITREFATERVENVLKIIEKEINSRLLFMTVSGPRPFIYSFTLESIGEGHPRNKGTNLSMKAKLETKIMDVPECILRMEKDLLKLKELIE